MPLTWWLQCVNTLLLLATALLCVRVGRRVVPGYHAAGWRLAGAAFLVHALSLVVQNTFGGMALAAGSASPVSEAYLRWDPVLNHGRTFLLVGMLLALLLLAVYRRQPDQQYWRISAGLLAAGLAAGTLIGVFEGRFTEAGHYFAVAIWDGVELLLLMVALFAHLLTSRIDRALWTLLTAYGSTLALGVFWFALLTRLGTPGWTPPLWTAQLPRLACHLVMLAAAWWRLRAALRGRRVPGMMELASRPVSTFA